MFDVLRARLSMPVFSDFQTVGMPLQNSIGGKRSAENVSVGMTETRTWGAKECQ